MPDGEAAPEDEGGRRPGRRGRGRGLRRFSLVTLVLVLVLGYAAARGALAAYAGDQGRRSLLVAEQRLSERDVDGARAAIASAGEAFSDADGHVRGLGPIAWVARVVPFVRVQMGAVDDFTAAGLLLADAGDRLLDAAEDVVEPEDGELRVATALDALQGTHDAIVEGRTSLDEAAARIEGLRDDRLLGPLATARDSFLEQVPDVVGRAASADQGLGALIAFAGGDGPRRYLLLSQNPDEPRPTGGFTGSYGVLAATGDLVDLERYDGIETWDPPLPPPSIPPEEAPAPFSVPTVPVPQTFYNVNATAHFPDSADLAMSMWEAAGEEPVDGVVAFTPELLARLLAVLGPVEVAEYGDTVDAGNLIERLDFWTHRPEVIDEPDRKQFLAALSELVVDRMLDAPAGQWEPLLSAVGDAFEAREVVAWTGDDEVTDALVARNWEGSLPDVAGDYVHVAEFAYTTKAGRGLVRTFDHEVTLREDGSAETTTTVTIANTLPFSDTGKINLDSLSYLTFFGPAGAVLDLSQTEPVYGLEDPIAGHPAAAIVAAAPPLGETSITYTWDAPAVALERVDGIWEYRLFWQHLPGRTDEMRLSVVIPPGWTWEGDAPPPTITLGAADFEGRWLLRPG